jgi:hypothetical protein
LALTPPRQPWHKRHRRALTALLGVLIVVAVVWFVYWLFAQHQSRVEASAFGDAVHQVQSADGRLRHRAAQLDPLVTQAGVTLGEAEQRLGPTAPATRGLNQAINVARSFLTTVSRNPSTKPSTRAGADSQLREDQDQLALVGPVKANLTTAEQTARDAVNSAKLASAVSTLNGVKGSLSGRLSKASAYRGRLDAKAQRIATRLNIALPLTLSGPIALPSHLTVAQKAQGKTMNRLIKAEVALGDVIDSATATRDAVVDETNLNAVTAGTAACQSAEKTLTAEVAKLKKQGLP